MSNLPTQQPTSMRSEEEQKLSALRTSAALQQGELPHNPELNVMLDRAAASLAASQLGGNLTAEGQKIAHDASSMVQTLKTVVDEKNRDEHLQKMHLHAKEAAKAAAPAGGLSSISRSLSGTTQLNTEHARTSVASATTLAQAIVADSELRNILWDMSLLVRDLFQSTPSATAALANVTNAPLGAASFSDATRQAPASTGPSLFEPAIAEPVRTETMSVDPVTGKPVVKTSYTFTKAVQQEQQPQSLRAGTSANTEEDDEDSESDDFRYQFTAEENDKYKRMFLSDTQLSEAKQRQLLERFVSLAQKLNADAARRDAIRALVDVLSIAGREMRPQAQKLKQQATDAAQDPAVQYHAQQASLEAQALLEAFAMNKSLDPLVNGWRGFIAQTRRDKRFEAHFGKMREFFFRSIDEPAFTQAPTFRGDLLKLVDEGRALLSEYRGLLFTITNELDDFLQCLRRDDTARRLADSTNALVKDLFYDDNGRATFKPTVVVELRKILVPLLVDQLKYIAVPRIAGSDETMDYSIENLVFRGQDILPDHIRLSNMNYLDVETRLGGHDKYESSIFVNISNIQAILKDVHFSYVRKQVPKLSDVGELDLLVDGKGISMSMWLTATQEAGHLFTPKRVHVDIQRVKIRNIRAEHKVLYTLLRPIIQNRIRRALIAAIEENVSRIALMIDERLVQLGNKAVDASPAITKLADSTTGLRATPSQQTAATSGLTAEGTRRDL